LGQVIDHLDPQGQLKRFVGSSKIRQAIDD
jgi:hypothetical protein